jgi:uncharacterized protein (DUF2384 family)
VSEDAPGTPDTADTADTAEAPDGPPVARKRGPMRFRRSSDSPRLSPDSVKRQGEITTLAFRLLGRDRAIAFLNTEHAELGGRPLDLATASPTGSAGVQAELERLGALQAQTQD